MYVTPIHKWSTFTLNLVRNLRKGKINEVSMWLQQSRICLTLPYPVSFKPRAFGVVILYILYIIYYIYYIYFHKSLTKIKAVTRLTAHLMCGVVSDLVICELREYDFVYDTKCPYWDKASLNNINSYSASRDNWCTVGGDGGCRVGEVRAGTTSPMPDHKGFKLQ